jgi:uncharacterized RDD family membrane protein YckC
MTSNESPGWGRRLACLLYETLVVFAVALIGFLLPQIVLNAQIVGHGLGTGISGQLMLVHLLLLLMAYFTWFWLHGGQTLPMKTWKMRLVSADGGRLRPLQAVLRYLAALMSLCLLGTGFLWAAFDTDRQYLHDRVAGTRIVLG